MYLPPFSLIPIKAFRGFSLVELLIALAILGVIATFTLPKLLSAQQNEKSNAIAKEAAAMVSGAFQEYKLQNTLTMAFKFDSLTPYMNYVSVDTSGGISVDGHPNGSVSFACSTPYKCLRLHNGAILAYSPAHTFCTSLTANTAIFFYIDPDGVYSGSGTTADSPSKSVVFWLYPDGKIRDFGTMASNTQWGSCSLYGSATPSYSPSWFSW